MKQNELDALRLLKTYTAGTFDVWRLMGPAKASCRAHILSILEQKKVPQGKAGVMTLEKAFWPLAQLAGGCKASRSAEFKVWALKTLQENPL